jgi:L-asparaginase
MFSKHAVSCKLIQYSYLPMNLRVIATGGTFDKTYDPLSGELIFSESCIPEVLMHARLANEISFQPLLALDSLDMQDSHREKILDACRASTEQQIVIIHGTDTMDATAEVLGKAALSHTIVLTGAMVPQRVKNSDAQFNLGFAFAAAKLLPSGVYVAMNAQIFNWNEVKKNRAIGKFEHK